MSHFEMTGETCVYRGRTLRRIRALKFLRHCGVLPGVLGGWIERKENLQGDGWVSGNAKVYDDGLVTDEGLVSGNAEVFEYAEVCARSRVSDYAKIFGHAVVQGNVADYAQVFGNAVVRSLGVSGCTIAGRARVFENCRISGTSWVGDDARIFGSACVQDRVRIGGTSAIFENASVIDQAWVSGESQIFGNAQLAGQTWLFDSPQVFENARVFDQALVGSAARIFGNAWVYGRSEIASNSQIFGYAKVTGDAVMPDFRRISGSTRIGDEASVVFADVLSTEQLDARAARQFKQGTFTFDPAQQCFSGGFESAFYFDHIGPNTYREVLRYCEGEEIEPEAGTEMYFTGSPRQLKTAVLKYHATPGGFMGYPVHFQKEFVTLFIGDLEVP